MIDENLTDKKLSGINKEVVKRLILKYVTDNGYIKGSYGYHNNNGTSYRGSPTVAEITRMLDDEIREEDLAPDTIEIDNWVDNLTPEGEYASYQEKIKDTWKKNYFVRGDLTLLCSAVNSFLKDKDYRSRQVARQERQIAYQEKVASASNAWAGEVGEDISFKVEEAGIATYIQPHYYNAPSYPLWKIIDEDGRTYSWGDTSSEAQIKRGDVIQAKIKRLKEFRGIKETQIWKVKITEGGRRGFFATSK